VSRAAHIPMYEYTKMIRLHSIVARRRRSSFKLVDNVVRLLDESIYALKVNRQHSDLCLRPQIAAYGDWGIVACTRHILISSGIAAQINGCGTAAVSRNSNSNLIAESEGVAIGGKKQERYRRCMPCGSVSWSYLDKRVFEREI
jgi:hypothetical protein